MRRGKWDFDCAILGGGPGGLVSALYLKRFRRSAIVINCGKPRAAWIPRTNNCMGFPDGISGKALLERLGRQVRKVGGERLSATARILRHGRGFEIHAGHHRMRARKIILATGIEDVQPDIENLHDLRARGLLRYCPICDAFDFREQPIGVLAKDDTGLVKALFISRFTGKLHVVVPADFRPSGRRLRALEKQGATIYQGALTEIEKSRGARGLWLHVDGHRPVFTRITYPMLGTIVHDLALEHLHGLNRTKQGYIHTTSEQETTIPGLYAVGDCVNVLAQISVAAGQAAVAATAVHNALA